MKPGDKVICIDAGNKPYWFPEHVNLEQDKVYTVANVDAEGMTISIKEVGGYYFYTDRFKPVDSVCVDKGSFFL